MFVRNSEEMFQENTDWMNLGITLFNDGAADPSADVDTEDEEEEVEDDSEDWTPPSKDEWKKLQEASKKAAAEAKNFRTKLAKNGIDPKTGKAKDAPTETEEKTGPTDLELKLFNKVVNASLKESGVSPSGLKLLIREFDIAEIDADDEDAISDKIEDLKSEYPDLFATQEETPARRGSGLGKKNDAPAPKRKNATQLLLESAGLR
jgi:hypothetical protein